MTKTKRRRARRARQSRPDDLVKRSYYVRECIADAFKQVNHGDLLVPVNAALLMWVALKKHPAFRDSVIDAAWSIDITDCERIDDRDEAVYAVAQRVIEDFEKTVWRNRIIAHVEALSPKDQQDLALQAESRSRSESRQAKPKDRKS